MASPFGVQLSEPVAPIGQRAFDAEAIGGPLADLISTSPSSILYCSPLIAFSVAKGVGFGQADVPKVIG